MNSKERVKKAFHFEKPDKVPIACVSLATDFFPIIQFEPRSWQPNAYPPHVSGGDPTLANLFVRTFAYKWKKQNRKEGGFPKKWWNYQGNRIDEWGIIWQSSGMKNNDLTLGHPVKGLFEENYDGLDDYQIPDASDDDRYRIAKTKAVKLLCKKKYTLGSMGVDGIFHRICHLRGFNNLLIDLARNPKQVEKLIEKILPFYLIQIQKFKDYYPPLDAIVIADDMGTQKSPFLSPRMFNKFIAPAYKKMIDLTHDLDMDFILHTCGEVYDLIQPFIDIGINVLEFDSPFMTGVERFKHYAEEEKMAFWLSSNIQTTYLYGTPKDVEEEIKYYIKEVGNNKGGLAIYEYTQNFALGTPKPNIKAQRKATKKWGNYNKQGVIEWLA